MHEMFSSLRWRPIGPFRGGRVGAVTGHPGAAMTFFFGSTGGGVWKTTNGGETWRNVSDGYFCRASVGAIAVADSDPNVIYAGMGECCLRGNIAPGDGVWRSDNGGRSWTHAGLEQTRHIGRIVVDTRDPDRVLVAALGHAFGPNPERGVYLSRDGGGTWELTLSRDADTGAVDLSADPSNPRVVFATLWQVRRYPWKLESGGAGSGLYRSDDGGETWTELTGALGLAPGPIGKIGVAVSPARPERVWAIVEAGDGGLFRSDDGGTSWERVSTAPGIGARAFYYMHLTAHPTDPQTIYVMNHLLWKSTDGGRSFVAVASPHPDHHALWIDPKDPGRMVLGCDGGCAVSFDGGNSWSTVYNQPTGEFYHVTTDGGYPYRVYGAQQDNSTLSVPSRSDALGIGMKECYDVGGSESGHIAVRPDDPAIVYAGSSGGGEGGRVTRYNHRLRQRRDISPWPEKTGGMAAREYTYRFQWTSPIALSPHDPGKLYVGANRIFQTTDEGEHWEIISPDLTRDDQKKQGPTGGPIHLDQSGVEVYCVVFAIAESPCRAGLIWAGTDDGRVHVTEDGGASWTDVTPVELPEWALVSSIEPSPHDARTAYIACTRYKLDDRRPYLFRTDDLGRTWTRITCGIDAEDYTRVVREDTEVPGLLYAGCESGVYVSLDQGAQWRCLQLNLPAVAVHDLAVHADDLVAATHGRSFWILDDLNPIRSAARGDGQGTCLFPPKPADALGTDRLMYLPIEQETDHPVTVQELPGANVFYVARRPGPHEAPVLLDAGENPPVGAVIHYHLAGDAPDGVVVVIEDGSGVELARFRGGAAESGPEAIGWRRGAHRLVWDLRGPGAEPLAGQSAAACRAVMAPGEYPITLEVGGKQYRQTLRVVGHPLSETTRQELAEQAHFLREVRDKVSQVHRAVNRSRRIAAEIGHWAERVKGTPLAAELTALAQRLGGLDDALVLNGALTHQGAIGSSPRLVDQLLHLFEVATTSDRRPTSQTRRVFSTASLRIDALLAELGQAMEELPALNARLQAERVEPIPTGD